MWEGFGRDAAAFFFLPMWRRTKMHAAREEPDIRAIWNPPVSRIPLLLPSALISQIGRHIDFGMPGTY